MLKQVPFCDMEPAGSGSSSGPDEDSKQRGPTIKSKSNKKNYSFLQYQRCPDWKIRNSTSYFWGLGCKDIGAHNLCLLARRWKRNQGRFVAICVGKSNIWS